MLVNQRTFTVVKGHMDEAVALLSESFAKLEPPVPTRILAGYVAPFDQLILETQHEDMAAYREDWDRLFGAPWFEEAIAKWNALTETGGTNYIWYVATD